MIVLLFGCKKSCSSGIAKCQTNPDEQDFLQPNSPVKIIVGKYKLKTGKVVKLTPKKVVRVRLDSEHYIDQKNCILINSYW